MSAAEEGNVGMFKFSGASDFDLLGDVFQGEFSKESSVVVRRAYSDGLGETDGSSHPSDTKNLSMRRTVSA